jgi:hypothetical protein
MKVHIELELPEEENDLLLMMAARRLFSALHDIDQRLRSVQKYSTNADEAIVECRQIAMRAMEDLE